MLSLRIWFIGVLVVIVRCRGVRDGSDCINPNSFPEQIRITLRPPDGVTISWKSYGRRIPNNRNGYRYGINDTPVPTVNYTIVGNASIYYNATGESTNYDNSSYGSWFHNVRISIAPSIIYEYWIVASLCTRDSARFRFKAPPVVGDNTSINIGIVGDLGLKTIDGRKTVDVLISRVNEADLFLHVGDISYADDHEFKREELYELSWNEFQNYTQPVTAQKFYMTAPGNHEATCFQGNDKEKCKRDAYTAYRNFSAYLHRFRMPGNESNGFENMWYSFDYGMAHFIVIDTETDFDGAPAGHNTHLNGGPFRPPKNQTLWFENDLIKANLNRSTVPWIIVAGHRPFFGSIPDFTNMSVGQNCESCRNAFARLMEQYNVDFYFCGHVHWYERLYPADQYGNATAHNYTNQPGTIYVTSGAGGAPEIVQHPRRNVSASANIQSLYGYVNLALFNATDAELSFIDTENNTRLDIVPIKRKRDRSNG